MRIIPRTHAKRTDPITSHMAARQLSDQATLMRDLLRVYRDFGALTAEEATDIARDHGVDVCSCGVRAWKRISDLKVLGYIDDTGQTRLSKQTGRQQQVRTITEDGLKELGA